jgi:hypothetical protein
LAARSSMIRNKISVSSLTGTPVFIKPMKLIYELELQDPVFKSTATYIAGIMFLDMLYLT